MSRLLALFCLLCALFCAACPEPEARTQVMAIVRADAQVEARARTLRIQVFGRSAEESTWQATAFDETIEPLPAFPYRVAVVPRGGKGNRQFRVVVEVEGDDGYHVRAQAIGGFQSGQTLAVHLLLDDRCDRVSCEEATESCRAGRCEDAFLSSDELTAYDPDDLTAPPRDDDAGAPDVDAGEDAGQPDRDAAVPECEASRTSCLADTLTVCSAQGTVESEETCGFGCAVSADRCNACAPDENVCADSTLTVCGSDGTVRSNDRCIAGCHPDGDRCEITACTPSTTTCMGSQLVACSASGQVLRDEVCVHGCNEEAASCRSCQPSTVQCHDARLVTCDDQGGIMAETQCVLGCNAGACLDIDPSNGLGGDLDLLRSSDVAVRLTLNAAIDTDTGAVSNGDGSAVDVASRTITLSDGTSLRVFRARSFTAHNVRVTGTAAVAVVSDGPIEITGIFDVSGDLGGRAGPGARPDSDPCRGGVSFDATSAGNYGGGGGGGGRSPGGQGGDGGQRGVAGGAAHGTPELVPLVGGCAGGYPVKSRGGPLAAAGPGGGAVQLVSRERITITGAIDAGGGGGGIWGAPYGFGGAGGGSGGGILLEAPEVEVRGMYASLTAHGGSGSSGASATTATGCYGITGEDGTRTRTSARGGASCALDSGAGADGAVSDGAPVTAGFGNFQGGGGGGAAGRIRINSVSRASIVDALVSPAASEGTVAVRTGAVR